MYNRRYSVLETSFSIIYFNYIYFCVSRNSSVPPNLEIVKSVLQKKRLRITDLDNANWSPKAGIIEATVVC